MTVYINALFVVHESKTWPYSHACHMFGGAQCEIHDLAQLIGLHPMWFRNIHPRGYYVLSPAKRKKAIANGAIELTEEQTTNFWRTGHAIFNSDIEIDINAKVEPNGN